MADPRQRRRLGRSAAHVTAMGFGAAPMGGFRGAIPPEESRGCVRTAYDAGLRYVDTSPYYGYGRSELVCGEVLRDLPRDSFALSTKVGRVMAPLAPGDDGADLRRGGLPFRPRFDYGRDGTLRSLEHSCLRLGLARVDIALIHDVDRFTHRDPAAVDAHYRAAVAGAVPALVELRAAGVIGAVGVGLNEVPMSLRFARDTDIDAILLAGRYTLLEQGDALDELLPLCERKGIGVVVGGPFNTGILVTGPVPGALHDYAPAAPEVLDKVGRIAGVCARHGVPLPAAALQLPLAHPAVASVIPGAMSRAELLQNIAWMEHPIPAALWAELRGEGLIDPRAPVP
jgi:D-threo-aldose 1-dehydrogenase